MALKPANPQIAVDGYWGEDTTKAFRRYFGVGDPNDGIMHGQWAAHIAANPGLVSRYWESDLAASGDDVIRCLQSFLTSNVDGVLGPQTIRAIQDHCDVPPQYQDGYFSAGSSTIMELQRRLNYGDIMHAAPIPYV